MRAIVALCASFCCSCASYSYNARIERLGAYENTAALEESAAELDDAEAAHVKVLVGTMPDGVEMKDGVIHADPARYEVLASVAADVNRPSSWNYMGWWPYAYNSGESWKRGYCGAQTPLAWVTLGMWAVISPLYYVPCWAMEGDSTVVIGERRDWLIRTLKRSAHVVGADLVVVTDVGDTVTYRVDNRTEIGRQRMTSAHGFALRTKEAATAAAP